MHVSFVTGGINPAHHLLCFTESDLTVLEINNLFVQHTPVGGKCYPLGTHLIIFMAVNYIHNILYSPPGYVPCKCVRHFKMISSIAFTSVHIVSFSAL